MNLSKRFSLSIPSNKVVKYLLSGSHTIGKHKAKFFFQFGFSFGQPEVFIEKIKELVENNNISNTRKNEYGVIYTVDGNLSTPIKISIRVRTVWIVLDKEKTATLVTAFPT